MKLNGTIRSELLRKEQMTGYEILKYTNPRGQFNLSIIDDGKDEHEPIMKRTVYVASVTGDLLLRLPIDQMINNLSQCGFIISYRNSSFELTITNHTVNELGDFEVSILSYEDDEHDSRYFEFYQDALDEFIDTLTSRLKKEGLGSTTL